MLKSSLSLALCAVASGAAFNARLSGSLSSGGNQVGREHHSASPLTRVEMAKSPEFRSPFDSEHLANLKELLFPQSGERVDLEKLKSIHQDALETRSEFDQPADLEDLVDPSHVLLGRVVNGVLRSTVKPFLTVAPFQQDLIETIRMLADKAYDELLPIDPNMKIESVSLEQCGAEWIQVKGDQPKKAILYLPGGAYIMGSPITHRRITLLLAEKTAAGVLAVDYRKAPENSLSDVIEDTYSGYQRLLSMGYRSEDIVLGGDSAGGHAAMALLSLLRERGDPMPAGVQLFSPWTDMQMRSASLIDNRDSESLVPIERMPELIERVIGDLETNHPMASPINADMTGYPPISIHLSKTEALHGDGKELERIARDHGVEVLLEEWDEMPHAFQMFGDLLPQGEQSLSLAAEFILQCHESRSEESKLC